MSPRGQASEIAGKIALARRGTTRFSQLSPAQMETFITQRELAASSLMVGGDLPTVDAASLRLLIELEMIICNQNGVMGTFVSEKDGIEVWLTPETGRDRESRRGGWIGDSNRTHAAKDVGLPREFLGLVPTSTVILTDVWHGQREYRFRANDGIKVSMSPDGVLFFHYKS
jgi:hypothetical protein